MASWFIPAKIGFAILFLGLLFWANLTVIHLGYQWFNTEPDKRAVVQSAPVGHCANVSEQYLIERGIDWFVDKIGRGLEQSGYSGDDNPYPYLTREAFVKANPDCCNVLKDIPGDFGEEIRPYLRGQAVPYLIAIRMKVIQHYTRDGEKMTTKVDQHAYVRCDGVAVSSWSLE